ncbi:MAG: PASTA domain-containing protein, partial [Ilumatobacter sp.]|uniref:PASTA domain-containing protein n=1 Tax=Ilumatobacter sp. TaxID=1967498 RepID=UPI003C72A79C
AVVDASADETEPAVVEGAPDADSTDAASEPEGQPGVPDAAGAADEDAAGAADEAADADAGEATDAVDETAAETDSASAATEPGAPVESTTDAEPVEPDDAPPAIDELDDESDPDTASAAASAPEPVADPVDDAALAETLLVPVVPRDEADDEADDQADDEADDEAEAESEEDDDALRIAGQPTIVAPVIDAAQPSPDPSEPTLYDDEPRRRRRAPIILLVLLLLIGLGALGYAGSLLLQPKSFAVPVLAGVPDDEALNQIAGNDWEITVEMERSDSFPEVDTVIRTVPGPGVELEEGEGFTLVLSAGPEFRLLPELDGLPFAAAQTQLTSLGLIGVEGPEPEFSEDTAVGSVISWQVQGDADSSMVAGAQILPGGTIEMTLSKGPEPRGVPALVGQTIEEATATLDALQLGLSQGEDVFSEDIPAGAIVSQDLAAESSVERGAIVTVQVSKGPDRIEFPALDGLTFTDAQTLLVDSGFTVGSLLGTTDGTFVEATVDGEDVAAGALFRRGQAIDLVFL